MNYFKQVVTLLVCFFASINLIAQTHPSLMLTKANLAAVKSGCNTLPLLKISYATIKADVDRALALPIIVPIPKDGGGGYTHEQHKKNYVNILNFATVYQISGDIKYANYVKDILLQYANQYQSWPIHPKSKNNKDGGRIFWQSLNDFVWQVYTIQGYDLVYDAISAKDRATIEQNLFMPILQFFTIDRKEVLDKIHNHGTWNLAAVGITGYVLNKPEYVKMALYGSTLDGKSGYLAQINQLFSPDGYYMEGPYYQRYALLPFVLFAKAINNYQPEIKIFQYRDKLLAKAIQTALQLTYINKAFFPINDAIKDKTYESIEIVYGLDIAYADIKAAPDLLDIAKKQGRVIISDAGLKVAKAVADGKAIPFKYESLWVKDGAKGDEGGLGILRSGPNTDQQCLLFKAASQGMDHGHFDRLNILFYDNNQEVFYDYGAARFLNIDSKGGGNYLPENDSWAKQTVAHNTLVVDQTSNFEANVKAADEQHPDLLYFSNTPDLQVVSAKEDHAYADVKLLRTTALVKVVENSKPLLIDVFRAKSANTHQYDLPFWYKGQMVNTSFELDARKNDLQALGKQFGYQHLWLNAQNQLDKNGGFVSILNNKRFYTTHFVSENPLQVKLVTIGATDPAMNLVDGKAFILSQPLAKNQTFVSITETHGGEDSINETVSGSISSISDLRLIHSDQVKTIITFKILDKKYAYQINYQQNENFIKLTTNK
jgi:hypothetical protein